ncbi:hypothetical protein [Bacillus manliponensis]|uniref:hypothetical protein n=1 Tax=Bacillus manliponensis TaxID=574376 RepID=UPI0035160F08
MTEKTVKKNHAGAIIHSNINEFSYLNIPLVLSEEDASIYEVLSAGFVGKDEVAAAMVDRIIMSREEIPIVTIRTGNNSAVAYRLPNELEEWVINAMSAAKAGNNPFPCKVAFGLIGDIFYVELK